MSFLTSNAVNEPSSRASNALSRGDTLTRRLARFSTLSTRDYEVLEQLGRYAERVPKGASIMVAGGVQNAVLPLMQGLAYRHFDFRDGRRQITGLLMPGDVCGAHLKDCKPVSYGIRAITAVRINRVPVDEFQHILAEHPAIAVALGRAKSLQNDIKDAWIVNIGQRDGLQRLAHLLSETFHRALEYGLIHSPGILSFPMTQYDFASALGLTSIHVNRLFKNLRDNSIVDVSDGLIEFRDIKALHALCGFNASYLEHHFSGMN